VITYWAFLFPYGGDSEDDDRNRFDFSRSVMDHSVDLGMLLIDFILNAIVFNPWHLIFGLIILFIYGILNMAIVIGTGFEIYSILTWDSIETFYTCIGITIAEIAFFMLYSYISICKNKRFN
jgi:hypothetical protein